MKPNGCSWDVAKVMAVLIDWNWIFLAGSGNESSDGEWPSVGNNNRAATRELIDHFPPLPFSSYEPRKTYDKLFKTSSRGAGLLSSPCSGNALPFLQLACRGGPWGGIDRPRAWQPHILHTSVSTGLLLASVKPTVYSLPAGPGACSGRGGAHCAALPRQWGHMGNRRISRSPFQRTIKQAQRIMRGSGHFRVTVFSITTDEKRGKVILSPFRAIIGETQGGEIYGFWTIPFLVDTLRMARAEIMATHHVHQINIMSEAAARGDLCVLTPGPREISLFLSFHFFKCILDTQ